MLTHASPVARRHVHTDRTDVLGTGPWASSASANWATTWAFALRRR